MPKKGAKKAIATKERPSFTRTKSKVNTILTFLNENETINVYPTEEYKPHIWKRGNFINARTEDCSVSQQVYAYMKNTEGHMLLYDEDKLKTRILNHDNKYFVPTEDDPPKLMRKTIKNMSEFQRAFLYFYSEFRYIPASNNVTIDNFFDDMTVFDMLEQDGKNTALLIDALRKKLRIEDARPAQLINAFFTMYPEEANYIFDDNVQEFQKKIMTGWQFNVPGIDEKGLDWFNAMRKENENSTSWSSLIKLQKMFVLFFTHLDRDYMDAVTMDALVKKNCKSKKEIQKLKCYEDDFEKRDEQQLDDYELSKKFSELNNQQMCRAMSKEKKCAPAYTDAVGEKRSRKNSKKGSKKKTNAEKKKSVPSARHVCQTSADETIFNACVKTPDEKIIEGSIKQKCQHYMKDDKYKARVAPCLRAKHTEFVSDTFDIESASMHRIYPNQSKSIWKQYGNDEMKAGIDEMESKGSRHIVA